MPRIGTLRPEYLLVLIVASGCYDFDAFVGPPADGPSVDLSLGADATPVAPGDLAGDLAVADSAVSVDLSAADLSTTLDLLVPADAAVVFDLSSHSDLSARPDLIPSCASGWADCDNNAQNGCEAPIAADAKNCGACGHLCQGNTPACWSSQCVAKVRALHVHADFAAFAADVQAKLLGTGAFSAVDSFDATLATPTLQQLQGYAAVLVSSNYSYKDAATLGDNLAAYFESGGRVVMALFADANGGAGYFPKGRFATTYQLLAPLTYDDPPPVDLLGTINEPQSPLVFGVQQFGAQRAYRGNGALQNGAVVVASWQSGKPLVVRGTFMGRTRVDLNFYPPSGDAMLKPADMDGRWVGDGANLLRNALLMQ